MRITMRKGNSKDPSKDQLIKILMKKKEKSLEIKGMVEDLEDVEVVAEVVEDNQGEDIITKRIEQ